METDTIVIGREAWALILITVVVGWWLALFFWISIRSSRRTVDELRQFIADFVDHPRVSEVLARRARILARNCARVVQLQTERAQDGVDAESIEAAFADATEKVRSYKPEFFRPLDGLKVAGFKARGNSHKAYIADVAEDLEAIDAARMRICQKLDALASVSASKS